MPIIDQGSLAAVFQNAGPSAKAPGPQIRTPISAQVWSWYVQVAQDLDPERP